VKRTHGQKAALTVTYAVLIIIAAVTVFPILWSFFASFKTNSEILTGGVRMLPESFQFSNYTRAWKLANFARYTWNSVYMTAVRIAGAILLSTMGGYVFARGKFPGKAVIFGAFTITMFISLGTMSLYPLVRISMALGTHRSLWGVILIRVLGVNVPYLYIVRGYVETIPRDLESAAKIDGCSFFTTYLYVILPLLPPVIATIGLLAFLQSWNDYLLPLVFTMQNLDQAPLTVGIMSLKYSGKFSSSWDLMLAGTMISIIPLIIVYVILNKFFITGLAKGALKG
jgi:multiple sugar transport system permease protein